MDETRTLRADVGDAELTDAVECEWTVFGSGKIRLKSDNGCVAKLDTHVEEDAYVLRRKLNLAPFLV